MILVAQQGRFPRDRVDFVRLVWVKRSGFFDSLAAPSLLPPPALHCATTPEGGTRVMEADLVAQRCALFCLSRRHPEWSAT
jgi:hypothetical protein